MRKPDQAAGPRRIGSIAARRAPTYTDAGGASVVHRECRQGSFGACHRAAALALLVPLLATATASSVALARPVPGQAASSGTLPDWALFWDHEQGTPSAGYSLSLGHAGRQPPAETALGDASASEQRFLAHAAELFRIPASDLVANDHRAARHLSHSHHVQFRAGLPVEGARLTLTLDREGRVIAFTSSLASDLTLASPGELTPRIQLAEARLRALAMLEGVRGVTWVSGDLAILPAVRAPASPRGEDTAGDAAEPQPERLIWRLTLRTADPPGGWRIFVDAHTGEIATCRSLTSALTGTVTGKIRTPNPWGTDATAPFPDLRVAASAHGEELAAGYTDSLGGFDLGDLVAADLMLEIPLEGRYASVRSESLAAAPARILVPDPQDPVAVVFDSALCSSAEREAYLHIQAAREHVRDLDATFDDPLYRLDRPIPIVVNDASLACNALALLDPEEPWLRFAAGQAGCVDLARLSSVVEHEYAHIVTMIAFAPEVAPEIMQEACSDFFSASFTDTSLVGVDWRGPGTWVRDLNEAFYWPVSPLCPYDPHCPGQLLATALWDMRARLMASFDDRADAVRYAETLVHFMRAAKPRTFEECLLHLLLQDLCPDPELDCPGVDGLNEAPHLDAIAGAFEDHGIGDFSVSIQHAPLADAPESGEPRQIRAVVSALYRLAYGRVIIHYRVDGGAYRELPMSGTDYGYSAWMPAQPAGTRVDYFITAEDERGHAGRIPEAAPSTFYSYRTGEDETPPQITHLSPTVAASGAERLWVSAYVSDNLHAVDSVWVEATRVGAGEPVTLSAPLTWKPAAHDADDYAQPDPPDLFEGTLPALGWVEGETIRYRLGAMDSTGLATTLPTTSAIEVPVRRGWNEDFEAGAPDVALTGVWIPTPIPPGPNAPTPEPSGELVLALLPGFIAGSPSTATFPTRNLEDWLLARLEFDLWHDLSGDNAGVRVLASTDGLAWEPVAPLGGYPAIADYDADGDGLADMPAAAWMGASAGWEHVVLPLDAYLTGGLQLRLEGFGARAPDCVFVDNVQVIEQRALPVVSNVRASQGEDSRVTLLWSALANPPQGFLGYEILRGPSLGAYDPTPRETVAPAETRWIDAAVSNGTRYAYAVRGVFEDGSAPLSAGVVGFPYRAAVTLPAAIEGRVDAGGTGADTLYVINSGDGELHVDVLYGASSDGVDDVRAVHHTGSSPPGVFRTLLRDPQDAASPDVDYVAVCEVSGSFLFRVGVHAPLPDPRAYTLLLLLDTDLSPATGLASPNIGADYIVAVGRMIDHATGSLSLGYVLDANWDFVERTSSVTAWEGLDSLEVGVRASTLGYPDSFACAVQLLLAEDPPPLPRLLDGDRAPDPPAIDWLSIEPYGGTAAPEAPLPIALRFDLSGHPVRTHSARLFVLTNDVQHSTVALPLEVRHAAQDLIVGLALRRAHPNPFTDTIEFMLDVPGGAGWRVDIVDVTGRSIRRIDIGRPSDPQTRALRWDGRTESGTRAPSGRYYVVAQGDGGREARPLLLIR
jgi:hypothetical protein